MITNCLKTKDEEKHPKADRRGNTFQFFREENNKTEEKLTEMKKVKR